MADGTGPALHPELRALQDRLNKIINDEVEVSGQVNRLARELAKTRRDTKQRSAMLEKLEEAYISLSKAPIVSLEEYWQVRLLLVSNRDLLEKGAETIRTVEKKAEAATKRLTQLRRDKDRIIKKMDQWGPVVRMKNGR